MDFINEMTGQHAGKPGATFAPPLAHENHYDLLEVDFGATKAQIREAYVRLKRTYSAQSQALYSVMTEEEAKQAMAAIEEAYHVLQDDHLRRSYDDKLRQRGVLPPRTTIPEPEVRGAEGDLSSDLDLVNLRNAERIQYLRSQQEKEDGAFGWAGESAAEEQRSRVKGIRYIKRLATQAAFPDKQEAVREVLAQSDLGDGATYKRIRELLDVGEGEMQERTKISLEYVRAIENNAFAKQPALVYVRGFIKSYLLYLGVKDYQPCVEAYSEKVKQWQLTSRD